MTEVVAALIWGWQPFFDLPAPGPQSPGLTVGICWRQGGTGETKEKALIRECREELAVTVSVQGIFRR